MAPKTFLSPWKHTAKEVKTDDANVRNRLYGRQWRKQRLYYLQANPLCLMCSEQGITKQATVVDHIKPHKGDENLFWDIRNWQPLCKKHHDSDKQKIDRRGRGG